MAERDRELPREFSVARCRSDSARMVRLCPKRPRKTSNLIIRPPFAGTRPNALVQELIAKSLSQLARELVAEPCSLVLVT